MNREARNDGQQVCKGVRDRNSWRCTAVAGGDGSRPGRSVLCFMRTERPEGDEDWFAGCHGNGVGYMSVNVHPTEEQDILDVHVTQHFECQNGSHMECMLADSLNSEAVCFPEGNWTGLETGGFAQELWLACSCFTPENPCDGSL